jgi:hypothetical protein
VSFELPASPTEGLGGGRWLVVENWSTFESLCAVAALADFDGRIIFGAGTQVGTGVRALAAAAAAPAQAVLYFGDIDAGGFRAARLAASAAQAAGWPAVVPCRQLYELALSSEHRLSQPPASAELAGWAGTWFGGQLGDKVRRSLARGLIVRQEAVGLEQLTGRSFPALIDDQSESVGDARGAGPRPDAG